MTAIRVIDVSKSFELEQSNATVPLQPAVGFATTFAAERMSKTFGLDRNRFQFLPEPPRMQALNHLSLEIRSGETMGVLGPSGCGKTTLLKVIAGLIQTDSGKVTYDDRDVSDVLPGDRRIGVVFQDYALYPHMQSQENIGFFFRLHKRAAEIPARVREVSQIMGVGFDQLLSRKPPTLSGGERQRVAVARCIARDPSVFLFDEPLSNLDAKLRVQTRVELKRLLDRYHVTGLYVTHDQVEAIALCDRMAIMREGQVEQVGTYQWLIDLPVNTFVAGFVGVPPMNLFDGRWTETGWQGADFEWPLPPRRRQMTGHQGTIGIRPLYVTINSDGPLMGRVALVEPIVSERVHLVHLEFGDTTCVARVPIDSAAASARLGDVVHFGFDSEQLMLFDGVSGKRL